MTRLPVAVSHQLLPYCDCGQRTSRQGAANLAAYRLLPTAQSWPLLGGEVGCDPRCGWTLGRVGQERAADVGRRVDQLHPATPRLHEDIVEGVATLLQPEQGYVGWCAHPQCAEIRPPHGRGRARRGARDHVGQRHAEVQELGERCRQVVHWTEHAELVNVAADHVGRHALHQHGFSGRVTEAARAVPEVQNETLLPELPNEWVDTALPIDEAVVVAGAAVRE